MAEETGTLQLTVAVLGGDEMDVDHLDEITRSLRSELGEIDGVAQVRQVQAAGGGKGAKGAGEWLSQLMLELRSNAIPGVLGFIQDWLSRAHLLLCHAAEMGRGSHHR